MADEPLGNRTGGNAGTRCRFKAGRTMRHGDDGLPRQEWANLSLGEAAKIGNLGL